MFVRLVVSVRWVHHRPTNGFALFVLSGLRRLAISGGVKDHPKSHVGRRTIGAVSRPRRNTVSPAIAAMTKERAALSDAITLH